MNAVTSQSALAMQTAERVYMEMDMLQRRTEREAELDTYRPYQIAQVINRYAFAFDSGDLTDITGENFEAINDALKDGDLLLVGKIIQDARKEYIAQLASQELYGRPGVITAAMVHA